MYLSYNTNGMAHHRLDEALQVLADLGYEGVALTPDVGHMDLLRSEEPDWRELREQLDRLRLRVVIETGARFVLDPRRKHWPNLVTRDPGEAERRIEYYARACRMARSLGGDVVSLWSGAVDPADRTTETEAFALLCTRLERVLDQAANEGVRVALEPEPGMLVDDLTRYRKLRRDLGREDLGTTLDIGHLIVTEPGAPHEHLGTFQDSLLHVQIDDARRGVHEHLPLGEGEIDFAPVIRALRGMGYTGALAAELSRDSHRAAAMAARTLETLRGLVAEG